MVADRASLPERAASCFSILRAASKDLNTISDELGKSIAEIDFALKKLNLGVSVWVPFHHDDGAPEASWYWSEDLGYAKAGSSWGICIRRVDGDYQGPDEAEREERWLFNDAPRRLRILAIDRIPDLLEELSKEAEKTTKEIRAKLEDMEAVAGVIKDATKTARSSPAAIATAPPRAACSPGKLTDGDLDAIRLAVAAALSRAGHASASQLLSGARWTMDGGGIRIAIAGLGKRMLSLTVNAGAEKTIRDELRRLSVTSPFTVVPADPAPPTDASAPGTKETK